MATSTVKVNFIGDAKDLNKAIDSADGKLGGFGESVGKFGKAATLAMGAGAVAAGVFAKSAIDAGSDLNESMSKVNVVFGESSDEIIKWADNSAKAFGQSKQQALEAAGTYGNLFQAFGVGAEESEKMSTSLVELASDLASFNNTSVDEALQALQSGLTGETEPLKRFGVAINETRIQMEAARLGLVKYAANQDEVDEIIAKSKIAHQEYAEAVAKYGADSVEASKKKAAADKLVEKYREAVKGEAQDLDQAAKAQAAYSLILQDTAAAQGDFARTSDGAANKQRIMQAQIQDLQATIGQKLLPVFQAVLSIIVDKLIPGIESLTEWLSEHQGVAKAAGAVIGGVFVAALIAWAASAAAAAAATIAAAAPVIAITAAIAALAAGVIYAYTHWGWFKTAVDAVAQFLTDTVWPALQVVAGFIADNFVPAIKILAFYYTDILWPALKLVVGFITDKVIPAFMEAWRWVQMMADKISSAFNAAKDVIEAAAKKILEWLNKIIGPMEKVLNLAADIGKKVGVIGEGNQLTPENIAKAEQAANADLNGNGIVGRMTSGVGVTGAGSRGGGGVSINVTAFSSAGVPEAVVQGLKEAQRMGFTQLVA